jgi:hypothetical protein
MSILFNNPLLGASGNQGGGGDLGDTIEQSLRFTGTQNLTKTMAAGAETTFSCWVKIANLAQTSAMTFIGAGIGTNYVQLYWEGATYETLGADNSNTSFAFTSNKLRDPSAWYHLVYVRTSSDTKIYINGAEASYRTSGSGSNGALSSTTFAIGSYANGTGKFEGYMAEVYFVESVKQPSDFGKYNEDGVWVPQDYTGTYGTNGFHLTFDSSQANGIGHDSSGNGNNFTASGFDEGDVALYSKDLFTNASTATPNYNTTDKTFLASNGADKAFDGSPSTQASTTYSPNTGTWIIFRPSTAIVANSSVQVRTYYNETITVNEVDTGLSNPSSSTISTVDISSALTFPVTIQTIGLRGNSTGSLSEARVFQIIVDGTVLVDNTDNDIDYLDTPTNNYAVLNPLLGRSASLNFEHANLRAQFGGGGSHAGMAGFGMPGSSGKYYWEVTLKEQKEGGLGIVSEDFDLEAGNTSFGTDTANGGQGWEWIVSEGRRDNNNVETNNSHTVPNVGDTIGFLLDTDAGTCTIEINGVAQTAGNGAEYTNIPTDKTIYPYFRLGGASGDANLDWNFGQMPFLYEPTGYQHVATNNLPEPTIKNGKEHFEAKLYSGTNSSNAITGLEFSPDLIWIKVRDAADNHVLVDTIRGTDSVLFSNSNDAEASSFSRFTSFDSNGFTVDTSDTAWNNSSNDYVAWCWKAGGTAVSNTNGTITSSVSANTEAGFSIVSYTGNSTLGATIGHGLSSAPECIFTKNRDTAADWAVYHVAQDATAPENKYMALNTADATATAVDRWNNTAPTSTVFTVGDAVQTNGANDMIAYCWHSVEGYSKFGSYTGNGSADGSYVELGFKPSLIILKSSSSAFDWQIYDSTRSPNNPATLTLRPNQTASEVTSGNDLDILSNGFKARDNGSINNNSGSTYVYMAFAESPFGGENAPPATAR